MTDSTRLDVAVVGGGVSGTYSAWRLQQTHGATQQIALYEYSDRIGGRLYSRKLPGLPNVIAELGGMRFIPEDHVMVNDLVTALELETQDFPMGSDLPIDPTAAKADQTPAHADNNLFYLRGQHFRYRDFAENPDRIPYRLAWSEQGYGPENLQVKIMDYLHPGFADLDLCDQMRVKVFGQEVWKFGFWNLLYRVLSNEGYQFMKDAGGYDANVANASAVTQLPATEYSDDTEFLTLKDGFQSLPLTLARQFEAAEGDRAKEHRIYMNQRLARIDIGDDSDYPYTLVFHKTFTTPAGKTADSECGTVTEVQARKVVLAMPRRSLELIESPLFEDEWLKKNIQSVLIQKAFKMFMAYEYPWWRSLGLVAGRSVTDLPIRQTYYMGTECLQSGGKPFTNSLLMVSYNDIETLPFWKGLEKGEPFRGFEPRLLERKFTAEEIVPEHEFQITRDMVEMAQRQVETLHDQKELPKPYSAVYQEWGDDPYGGGWHEWKANHRIDQIMCRMRNPVPDQQIFIVGEAYSYEQGWVEGALNTAESMLEEFFGLEKPKWLSNDHQFLPVPCPDGCQLDSSDPLECHDGSETLDTVTEFAYEAINHIE